MSSHSKKPRRRVSLRRLSDSDSLRSHEKRDRNRHNKVPSKLRRLKSRLLQSHRGVSSNRNDNLRHLSRLNGRLGVSSNDGDLKSGQKNRGDGVFSNLSRRYSTHTNRH